MAGTKLHNPEEKLEIAKAVCEKYATGLYTIASCAENEGVSIRTFTTWTDEIAEIADMYKQAKKECSYNQRGELKKACLTSLMKLVTGYEVEEVHQEGTPQYSKDGKTLVSTKTTKIRRIKKHYQPNVTAVIFALKAMDPETFKDYRPLEQQEEQVFMIGGKPVHF